MTLILTTNQKNKNMSIRKLSMTINSFDATEHLYSSISSVRDQIDHVAAIYQKQSYWKNPMADEDMEELLHLKNIGLIDELIEFKPNFAKYSREQECDKRNMGIELMKANGSSHIINVDADEYYTPDQFEYGVNLIEEKNYNITYCSYVNYYKDFNHYLVYPFRPLVPFIQSTYYRYTYQGPAPGPTDPTRRIKNPFKIGEYIFRDDEIRMAHAAWVRKDIRKKLVNWSAKNHFEKELIDKAVERWENWEEGQTAVMLFNTPDNSVKVNKLEKRIHDFEVPWLVNEIKQ